MKKLIRNVTILGRRTSMRIEPEIWAALLDAARREGLTVHELCTRIRQRVGPDEPLAAAVRVFAVTYFAASSTEDGHRAAGHGDSPASLRCGK